MSQSLCTPILSVIFVLLFPLVVHSIPLLDGLFETSTDVTGYLNLAIDVADIQETETRHEKLNIYRLGRNAFFTAEGSSNGQKSVLSLASLSFTAGEQMSQDPMYNIFRHSFRISGEEEGNESGLFGGRPVEEYANTIVEDILALPNMPQHMETETMLLLNVWMAVVHELYEVARGCTTQEMDASQKALDRAAALWIGAMTTTTKQQQSGSSSPGQGHMLYTLAETAAERFVQTNGGNGGTSLVNQRVLEFFNSLQINLSSDLSCLPGFENTLIRDEVQNLIGVMTVPLIQNLIHHIMDADTTDEGRSDFIELYALSVAPRVVACDPNLHDFIEALKVPETADVTEKRAAVKALQSVYTCLKVSCEDIGSYKGDLLLTCENEAVDGISLAGYASPRTSALPWSFVDRDILQMRIFMEAHAYEAALDLYMYGHNSGQTLQQLALNEAIPQSPHSPFDLFRTYYQTDSYTFVDSTIITALQLESPYNQASPDQLSELVVGLLKYVVVHLSVMAALHFAVEECWSHHPDSALHYWDVGAALYVGSIEGSRSGGQEGGQLLYATAKEACGKFGTCNRNDNNAFVNQAMIDALNTAMKLLENNDCHSVNTTLQNQISQAMPVILIQGTLAYASVNDGLPASSPDGSLATGFAFSQSVLPYVQAVNEINADLIKRNMELQFDYTPMVDGFETIADVFRKSLVGMGVYCADIGTLGSSGFCPQNVGPNTVASPDYAPPTTALAFGRYNFTSQSNSELFSSFALDIRDMAHAATVNDARTIYRYGSNAVSLDSSQTLDLASFSTDASKAMSQDPMFNIFKFALYDETTFQGLNDFGYAHEVVTEALERASDLELATDGVVALHVWMMVAHKLYSAVRQCKQGKDAKVLIDTAVALWIGKDQQEASTNGWMLYSVGQAASMNFGHDGEASTNSELMIQFNEMQRVAGQCSQDSNLHLDLRRQLSGIMRLLTIPLLQQLLFSIAVEDRWHVELYAMSVVSQLVACHPRAYSELRNSLYSDFSKEKVDDDVVDHLVTFMECTRISCEDIGASTTAPPFLQDIVKKICQRMNQRSSAFSIRGYVPSANVRELSRIDLDILQIGIFMRTEANEAALDYYVNGHNSLTHSSHAGGLGNIPLSLQTLATAAERPQNLNFELFANYYGTDSYADDLILQSVDKAYPMSDASPEQLSAIVTGTLQAMVSYGTILTMLQTSVERCERSEREGAQSEWDGAVAMFVGSIEMIYPEQSPGSSGVLMYSLGLDQCQYFDTCQETGEAFSNVALLKYFTTGKGFIENGKCTLAGSIIASNISPLMQTLMVQGTLNYAIKNENLSEGATEVSLASGFVLSKSIEPLVNSANATSARTLARSFEFPLRNASIPEGAEAVFGAFRHVLRNMSIDCDDIGQPLERPELSACLGTPEADYVPAFGVEVYIPTSVVRQQANIALDVAEMTRALSSGLPSVAKLIYSEGKNSEILGENGQFMKMRTLQGMSVESTSEMLDDPLFNIFMFALQQESGGNGVKEVDDRRLLAEAREYADIIVLEALDSSEFNNSTLASEASVALNVWMYTAHALYDVVRKCRDEEVEDGDGERAIDEASAYWIGDGQGFQDADGHLLYGLAESMGRLFTTVEHGQSKTNRHILKLLDDAKNEIAVPATCSGNPATLSRLYRIINKVISMMTIPLVQGLLHNLKVNDRDRVKVFAYSFVPLTASCSPETFAFLHNKLIHRTYDPSEANEIIDHIYEILPCLGLRCEDIGIHIADRLGNIFANVQGNETLPTPSCSAPPSLSPMAGYHPGSNVIAYAQLDLDLLEMDILMQMNAFEAAADIYQYGKHSSYVTETNGTSLSLAQVAMTSEQTLIPIFSSFSQYYETDKFVDQFIRDSLLGSETSIVTEVDDRRAIVLRASQVMIAYSGAISAMYDASKECQTNPGSTHAWDRAAAFMIGHMEGPENGGSKDEGYFLFDLAQEQCQEFGTCTQNQTAMSNDRLVTFLYAGRGAVKSNSCNSLDKMKEQISSTLLVPMIQAIVSASLKLSSDNNNNNIRHDALVEGHVFSRALLPLVAEVDRVAADAIQDVFDLSREGGDGRLLPIDKTIILAAFSRVYEDLDINCLHIGQAEGIDACTTFDLDALLRNKKKTNHGGGGDNNGGDLLSEGVIGIITVLVVVLIAIVMIVRIESKKKIWTPSVDKKSWEESSSSFFTKRNKTTTEDSRKKGRTFLSRRNFPANSSILSSEAIRLTTSLRFSEHRAQAGDDDDEDDYDQTENDDSATLVMSNMDGREPPDVACC